jgi:hypothetical protein
VPLAGPQQIEPHCDGPIGPAAAHSSPTMHAGPDPHLQVDVSGTHHSPGLQQFVPHWFVIGHFIVAPQNGAASGAASRPASRFAVQQSSSPQLALTKATARIQTIRITPAYVRLLARARTIEDRGSRPEQRQAALARWFSAPKSCDWLLPDGS